MRYRPYLTAACLLLAACGTQPADLNPNPPAEKTNLDPDALQAEHNARNDAIFLNQAVPLKQFFDLPAENVQSIDLYVMNVLSSTRVEKPEDLIAKIPQNYILMTNGHASVKAENIPEIIQDIANIRAMPYKKDYDFFYNRLLIRVKYNSGRIIDIMTVERKGYSSFLHGFILIKNQEPIYVNFSLEDINQIFTKTNPELTVFQYK